LRTKKLKPLHQLPKHLQPKRGETLELRNWILPKQKQTTQITFA